MTTKAYSDIALPTISVCLYQYKFLISFFDSIKAKKKIPIEEESGVHSISYFLSKKEENTVIVCVRRVVWVCV